MRETYRIAKEVKEDNRYKLLRERKDKQEYVEARAFLCTHT